MTLEDQFLQSHLFTSGRGTRKEVCHIPTTKSNKQQQHIPTQQQPHRSSYTKTINISMTSTTEATNQPLQAYFATLLAGAALADLEIDIVDDNAKLPDESLTKTRPTKPQHRHIDPDENFSFLPSRWESYGTPTTVPKPCVPQRQISIELPFFGTTAAGSIYSEEEDGEDTSTDLSYFSDYSSSNSENANTNNEATTRWTVSKFQPLPKPPSRVVRTESYGSLSSTSSHSVVTRT